MNKELFIESIEALKTQYEHDKKCGDAFQLILPDTHVGLYDNHLVNNQIIKILQRSMNDEHKDSWIEYFCFELDFGRLQTKDFHAWGKDGTPIDLGSAGSLWEFLNKLNSDKNPDECDATKSNQGTEPMAQKNIITPEKEEKKI